MRSDLNNDTRRKVNTLIITDVHARDIIDKFVRDSIMDAREFAWESQLRFYWDKGLVSCSQGLPGNSMLAPKLSCGPSTYMRCRVMLCCRMTWLSSSARARSSMAMSSWASTAAWSSQRSRTGVT